MLTKSEYLHRCSQSIDFTQVCNIERLIKQVKEGYIHLSVPHVYEYLSEADTCVILRILMFCDAPELLIDKTSGFVLGGTWFKAIYSFINEGATLGHLGSLRTAMISYEDLDAGQKYRLLTCRVRTGYINMSDDE
jgi:hypothetical protein